MTAVPASRRCDPVGAVEIAERAGVARGTVDAWRTRHANFPPPRWTVGGRPAWNWDDVEAWLTLPRPGKATPPTTTQPRSTP